MTDVVAHLRACAARYAERHRKPVVAWDCMGAAKWGEVCNRLADEIEDLGLPREQAVGYLKAKAKQGRDGAGDGRGVGLLISLDMWREFDRIIDPIARDRVGWIEVSGHREHFGRDGFEGLPEYRRMLGANHCVAFLSRDRKEAPVRRGTAIQERRYTIEAADKWEERRLAWLSQYHPGIPVIHKEGGYMRDGSETRSYTPIYGTVEQHMAESLPYALSVPFGLTMSLSAPLAAAA